MNINWDEDLVDSPQKKTAQKGRRAGLTQSPTTPDAVSSASGENSEPQMQTRKTGGWSMDTIIKSAKSKGVPTSNLIEQERFHVMQKSESDDDIPVIPDIEDVHDAHVHSAVSNSVPSSIMTAYKELDSELLNESIFTSLGDVDLSILTKHLYLDEPLEEPDVPWDVDSLYTELVKDN